jgi:hypothetical protein
MIKNGSLLNTAFGGKLKVILILQHKISSAEANRAKIFFTSKFRNDCSL